VKFNTVNIPTLDETLIVCSLRAVVPSNWEKFKFPQAELQERPSASCDTSYVPQGDQEQHLTQQRESKDLESLKATSRRYSIMTVAGELVGYKIRCPYSRNFKTYFSALRPPEGLGLLNYGRPVFPIKCFLSPSLNLVSCRSFSTSPSHLILGLLLLLLPYNIFPYLNSHSQIQCFYMSCSSQNFLLISATMSTYLYSSLISWLDLIIHVPYTTTGSF